MVRKSSREDEMDWTEGEVWVLVEDESISKNRKVGKLSEKSQLSIITYGLLRP